MSSPLTGIGKYAIPLINILITAYTFTTGMHVDQVMLIFVLNEERYTNTYLIKIATFFQHLRCACPGRSMMYELSGNVINKVVYNFWLRMQVCRVTFHHPTFNDYYKEKLITERINRTPLHLGGDGSYDSPGFCARYCNYVVMDLTTSHILAFFTAIKFQVWF